MWVIMPAYNTGKRWGGSGAQQLGGFPQDTHGMNETQSAGIEIHRQGGLVHEEPDGVVGQEDAVDFLEDAAGGAAPEIDESIQLLGFQFVVADLDFPAFMVQNHQFGGRKSWSIEQRGDQTMTLPVAWTFWIIEGVVDHPNGHSVGLTPTVAPGRVDHRQVRSVLERANTLEDDVTGYASQDLYAASPGLLQRGMAIETAIPQHQRALRHFSAATSRPGGIRRVWRV